MKFLKFLTIQSIIVLALVIILAVVTRLPITNAAFPGQNGKIAFTSKQHGEPIQIYLMDTNGSNQTRLTFASGNDSEPAWSPDGTKIAFSTNRSPAPSNEQRIWVMDANGSNVTILTSFNSGRPAWSPAGTKIAFHGIIGGDPEIYVMDANGSNQTPLTSTTGGNGHPAWSPDGSKIAFYSSRDGNNEIYVMDANGSNQTRLTTTTGASEFLPDWSPDGSKIAFQSDRDGNYEIYVMDTNGSNQINLTTSVGNDGWPAWSPDGSKILFNSDRDGDFEIFVMDANGSGQTNLTVNSVYDAQPSWQPIPPISVAIDIKPGSDPNCFNSDGHGAIPVAILGSSSFDVTQVDPGTVSLDGQAVKAVGKSDKLLAHTEDSNNDGYMDLVVQIQDADGTYQVGNTSAKLTGKTFGGQFIQGTDSICIVQ